MNEQHKRLVGVSILTVLVLTTIVSAIYLFPTRSAPQYHPTVSSQPMGLCPIAYSYRGSASGTVTIQEESSSDWIFLSMTFTYPNGTIIMRDQIYDVSELLAANQELAWIYGGGDSGHITMSRQGAVGLYDYVGKMATVNGTSDFQSTVAAPMVQFRNPNSFPVTITYSIVLSGYLEYRQNGASCIFGMR